MLEGWEQVRELRRELKTEWAQLWMTKYDDNVRAEDVSRSEFDMLFVNRGEVIYATRDYQPLSFREILERHLGSDVVAKAYPNPVMGGWRKFVKKHLQRPKLVKKREKPKIKVDLKQHQRKGGAGWLNRARIWKKISLSGFVD